MKNFKKILNEDLNSILPDLRDDIKEEYYEKCDLVKKNRFNFKFLMPISVVVSMIIILIFLLIPNNNNYTALLLEINPKVIFTLDDENIVTNVVSVNSDADVILSDDNRLEEMINKKAEDALVIFTEYAYKMGYLNDDSNTIKLSSCGNENISNVVVNNIEEFLSNNNLFTVVYNEEISINSLANILDIKCDNLIEFSEKINEINHMYIMRTNQTIEEIKLVYEEIVNEEDLASTIIRALNQKIEDIQNYKLKLQQLYDLNLDVLNSDDNPGIFGLKLDYWTIKSLFDINEIDTSDEFKELLVNIENLISEINDSYKLEIDSLSTLILEIDKIERTLLMIELTDLTNLIANLLDIVDVIKKFNLEVENIINLFSVPNSKEEFISKIKEYSNIKLNEFNEK